MLDESSERRIARYVAGECSPQEAAEVRAWIAADPERAAYAAALQGVWAATGRLPRRYDATAAWALVRDRIRGGLGHGRGAVPQAAPQESAPPAGPRLVPVDLPAALPADLPAGAPAPRARRAAGRAGRPPAWSARSVWRARVAAALAVATLGATWWGAASRGAERRAAAAAPLREVATRRGQKVNVYLSDGTHVVLGAESRLRFAAPLGATGRDVYLDGEALFEVTHDARAPFLVHTARAVTEDLGTTFAVRAHAGDSAVTVVVAEGRAALRPAGAGAGRAAPAVVLNPGDLGRVDARGRLTAARGVVVDQYLGWAEGRFRFADAPLRSALPELGRHYDLTFRLADPTLGERRLTATFADVRAPELLRELALTLDLRVTRDGNVVTLHPQ